MAKKVVLLVEGMMCQKNCGATVAGALRGVPGVMEVDVSFPKSAAYVLVDVDKVSSLGHFVSLCVGAVEAVGLIATDSRTKPSKSICDSNHDRIANFVCSLLGFINVDRRDGVCICRLYFFETLCKSFSIFSV